MSSTARSGPVVFAYDGSDLALRAIDEAGQLLGPGREAVALTVWQPFNVGFVPAGSLTFDAAEVGAVKRAAEHVAAQGAARAAEAGFQARSQAIEAAASWRAIVEFADECDASLIVLGSHGGSGLVNRFVGSVAGAVAAHSRRSVLIVHRPAS